MPIYAYRCAACGHDFDRLQKLSDPDPDACPSCGASGQVRRQVTAPSFRLAGSGWYETDFKKDGDKKRNLVEGKESAAAKPEAATADAKPAADAQPAAKPAAKPVETAKAAPAKPTPAS
ncbi:FmdB family zinc ribbon protein [Luteimonas notoginsengisoli]|jgi:putative FmdB family regulatory protein|uniref:FmdB family zinc ribbon protein n=1 Tax=Luteimonas notoginsengisoli TaxID=1578200 RepID=A0ABV7UUN0_9GAMM